MCVHPWFDVLVIAAFVFAMFVGVLAGREIERERRK